MNRKEKNQMLCTFKEIRAFTDDHEKDFIKEVFDEESPLDYPAIFKVYNESYTKFAYTYNKTHDPKLDPRAFYNQYKPLETV